jgi:toxin-antitoxin system PIN domain toxin
MTGFLLDVNVLVALMWPAHVHHAQVHHWFARTAKAGWATCPLTQSAVVRILSNPGFSRDAVTPQEAVRLLKANLNHPTHRFWPDQISFVAAADPVLRQLTGHQQVTDVYLLGLARHRKGSLATMDRAILTLLPENLRATSVTVI